MCSCIGALSNVLGLFHFVIPKSFVPPQARTLELSTLFFWLNETRVVYLRNISFG